MSPEERRRLELILESTRVPAPPPEGWREPDPEHPGLVGEARARMEAQKRKWLADALRGEARDLYDRKRPTVTGEY
jgi:hypothetical protein